MGPKKNMIEQADCIAREFAKILKSRLDKSSQLFYQIDIKHYGWGILKGKNRLDYKVSVATFNENSYIQVHIIYPSKLVKNIMKEGFLTYGPVHRMEGLVDQALRLIKEDAQKPHFSLLD